MVRLQCLIDEMNGIEMKKKTEYHSFMYREAYGYPDNIEVFSAILANVNAYRKESENHVE
jgi:hypothetical protein